MSQGFSTPKANIAGNGMTQIFVNGEKQDSTSGTSIDFTIPSGVKQLNVMFETIGSASSSSLMFQLGDSGGIETSGYRVNRAIMSTVVSVDYWNNGFQSENVVVLSTGAFTFNLLDAATNTWIGRGQSVRGSTTVTVITQGSKSLTGELTTLRMTTASGTAVFNSGRVNVSYDNPDPTVIADSGHGIVVQQVHEQTGVEATTTTLIPNDTSIPQNTEGAENMTVSITPTKSTNLLKIEVVWQGTHFAIGEQTAALFQDSTADCLACGARNSVADRMLNIMFTHWMTAGTIASTTFKVRAGNNTAGTTIFNSLSSSRDQGGSRASSITVTEYEA